LSSHLSMQATIALGSLMFMQGLLQSIVQFAFAIIPSSSTSRADVGTGCDLSEVVLVLGWKTSTATTIAALVMPMISAAARVSSCEILGASGGGAASIGASGGAALEGGSKSSAKGALRPLAELAVTHRATTLRAADHHDRRPRARSLRTSSASLLGLAHRLSCNTFHSIAAPGNSGGPARGCMQRPTLSVLSTRRRSGQCP